MVMLIFMIRCRITHVVVYIWREWSSRKEGQGKTCVHLTIPSKFWDAEEEEFEFELGHASPSTSPCKLKERADAPKLLVFGKSEHLTEAYGRSMQTDRHEEERVAYENTYDVLVLALLCAQSGYVPETGVQGEATTQCTRLCEG